MARAVGNHVGAFDSGAAQDIKDTDAMQGAPIVISGTADAINPHNSGNYIVATAGVDAMVLTAPTAGIDDNLSIAIFSDTLNAHTITATSLFASGASAGLKSTATFAAFRGAGVILRAYNGVWQVVGQTGISFT